MEPLSFVLSQLTFVLFGAPAAFHPSIRPMGWPARIAASFGLGAIVLTLEAMLFSLCGLRWGNRTLAIPLVLIAAIISWRLRKHPAEPRRPLRPNVLTGLLAGSLIAVTLLLFVHALVIGTATSVEFVLFEGTKAVRFAVAKGFDANFLRSPFSVHTHPGAPPLFPATLSWFALGREEPMWTWAPLSAAIWLMASIPLVLELLRRVLHDTVALTATAFWTVAMAAALTHAHSAGTADASWLFYGTVAFAALLTERGSGASTPLAAGALSGLALTKSGGVLFSLILVAVFATSTFIVSRKSLHPAFSRSVGRLAIVFTAPLFSAGLWGVFLIVNHLALRDPSAGSFSLWSSRWWEAVAGSETAALHAGTWGLAFIIPATVILLSVRHWNGWMLAGVIFVSAAMAIASITYMKEWTDPTDLIATTFPHLMQWPLSILIITAGFAQRRDHELFATDTSEKPARFQQS
ncbi:MAG: hypothetical protein ABI718_13795 [Acidobacteriota bacterium]